MISIVLDLTLVRTSMYKTLWLFYDFNLFLMLKRLVQKLCFLGLNHIVIPINNNNNNKHKFIFFRQFTSVQFKNVSLILYERRVAVRHFCLSTIEASTLTKLQGIQYFITLH